MKKSIITLAALAGVGIASLGGIAAFVAPASASTSTTSASTGKSAHGTVEKTTTPSDVDPDLQAWYDSNGTGDRPAGVKEVGSPAEVKALQASAEAEGKCYQAAGYDVPIADTAAGDGIQVPEHISRADATKCATVGQDTYDSEYQRLGGR